MKKFFLYILILVTVLGAIFTYILYTEGAFETVENMQEVELKPFPTMKCESGKCREGRCGSN